MISAVLNRTSPIVYPESDGTPVSDNLKQFRWIYMLYANLEALFRDNSDVFVGGNQNWYPVENHPEIVQAPDVYVVFGRPKGDRGSYQQWEEGDVPMTVVFEVLSPSNTWKEMIKKFNFYDDYGVQEYYVFDPDDNGLTVFTRGTETLVPRRPAHGFLSPRLGIRFDLSGDEMVVYKLNGEQFLTFTALQAERDAVRQQANAAKQRAETAEQQAEAARQRERRLAELSRKARHSQVSPEELAELERLENEAVDAG
jgi:Uma2 family endonuclease